ncbi:unnamed protein product [Chilo suppressalis]|uniref:Uncharacterized protein n=1 Tax=Chilo suppressalis TaxID=168631 RepID=A0ABN8BCM9_CHISP|nr:unnamed protein product [Chilo suppressalis]
MYVIYPADEVVSLTYTSHSLPRPRQRPTLDVLFGPLLPPPSVAQSPPPPLPLPTSSRSWFSLKTAPPEPPERAPASPTPSLERPAKQKTKAKLFKKLVRQEDNEFGKIVRTPAPDEFELPAPLPTPAFSRKNIFDRDFDALFEVANSPQFTAKIRVTTPEPDRRSDVSAAHFPSPATSSLSLLPPRPYSEPTSASPNTSGRSSSHSTPTPHQSEGANSKSKKVSFFRKWSHSKGPSPPRARSMQQPSLEMALRELNHPSHNEQLKNQQQVTFKLVKTAVATICRYYNHYQDNKIRFTTRTDYLEWNTTFPSITVCEMADIEKIWMRNEKLKDNTTEKLDNLIKEIAFFDGTCYSCLSICEEELVCNLNHSQTISMYRSSCKQMFLTCNWNNNPINCCKYFKPIQTEYGICFSFNNLHSKVKENIYRVTTSNTQKKDTFEVMLTQNYEAFIHSPEDVPFWNMEYDRRITIFRGSQARIVFSILDVVNEPEVSLTTPDVRQCRFEDEVPSNYIGYDKYSYSVCITECRIRAQLELCNCTHRLSPRGYKDKYCDLDGLKCLTRHFKTLSKLKVPGTNDSGIDCDCLPSCNEPDYNIVSKMLTEPEKDTKTEVNLAHALLVDQKEGLLE